MALWAGSAHAVHPLALPGGMAALGYTVFALRRPEYGLAGVLALFPLKNLSVAGTQPLRLALPLASVGLLAYAILLARQKPGRIRAGGTASVTFFVAVAVASSAQALDPELSGTRVLSLVVAAALFLAVMQICRERSQLMVVVAGAVAGLLIASVQGVLQHFLGTYSDIVTITDGQIVGRVKGSFGHPNQYAGFLAVLLPLAGSLLCTARVRPVLRILSAAAMAVGLPALAYTAARGAVVALAVGSVVWLAVVRPRAAAILAVGCVVGGLALLPATLKERFEGGTADDVGVRADLWGSALDIYAPRPVLGVGLNNFSEAYAALPSTVSNASQRRLLHQDQVLVPPHAANLYLNVLAEEGVVGIVALGLLGFTALRLAYRGSSLRDPMGAAVCVGVGAGWVVLALHNLLEVTLFEGLPQPVFALLAVSAMYVALDDESIGTERRVPVVS